MNKTVYRCAYCLSKYDENGVSLPQSTKATEYKERNCKSCIAAFGGPHGVIVLGDPYDN